MGRSCQKTLLSMGDEAYRADASSVAPAWKTTWHSEGRGAKSALGYLARGRNKKWRTANRHVSQPQKQKKHIMSIIQKR